VSKQSNPHYYNGSSQNRTVALRDGHVEPHGCPPMARRSSDSAIPAQARMNNACSHLAKHFNEKSTNGNGNPAWPWSYKFHPFAIITLFPFMYNEASLPWGLCF
jgi:hypothetical protein